jgi:hypothetical protein
MMPGARRRDDSNDYRAILRMVWHDQWRQRQDWAAAKGWTADDQRSAGRSRRRDRNAGVAVGSSHLTLAVRQWIRNMEVPPSELAKLRWAQAKTAATAAAAAWQNGHSADLESVS